MPKETSRTTTVRDVMIRLLQMLQTNTVKPGERLPSERRLATAFGVSRGTIRTATQILAFNQFLIIKPGSGIYFNEFSTQANEILRQVSESNPLPLAKDKDFIMLAECRLIIEPSVARLAALYSTENQLRELKQIVERMKAYVESQSMGGYAVEDMCFHRVLAAATNNPYMIKVADDYSMDLNYLLAFERTPNLEKESYERHLALYNAIAQHNPDLAQSLMEEHVYFGLMKNQGYIIQKGAVLREGVLDQKRFKD